MKLDPEVWGSIFPELVGPDETQRWPILGFRINRVQLVRRSWGKPSVAVRSMGLSEYAWEPGRNEAVCLLPGRPAHDQPRHVAPAMGCSCGLYAVHDLDYLTWITTLDSDYFVLAGVAGTGVVRVHTDGWRAQFARIVAFSVDLPELPFGWTLTPRERRILALRLGVIDGHQRTLEEVGKRFGIGPHRVRQIEAIALQKLNSSRRPSRRKEAPWRLPATAAEALEAKYQVPVVPLDKLKEVIAGAGRFWEEMR